MDKKLQQQIREELGTTHTGTDMKIEVEKRVTFLHDYILKTGTQGLVLGISGGVDSTVAGRLCQLAVEKVRQVRGHCTVRFIAVRLPYGQQKDENDAQEALEFIKPDLVLDINIKKSTDALWDEILDNSSMTLDNFDYHKGNVKARERMIVQFAIAGMNKMLVVGTDHAAEAITGFYTKFGDGAADLTPLAGLNKRQVRKIAEVLGAPYALSQKVATADLEDEKPLLPDEVALGISYTDIDDYLEGKDIPEESEKILLNHYHKSAHKRSLPVAPYNC